MSKKNITKSVVPIKVRVGATLDDKPKFPDWQLLPMADKKSPLEEMYFSWMYDRIGYKQNTEHSPYGVQWAIRLVSKKLAKEAAKTFPSLVTILTEDQLRDFWNDHITADLPDQLHDHNELVALNARLSIIKMLKEDEIEVRDRIRKALDPDNNALGVRRHPYKSWDVFKKFNNIRIVSI